MVGKKRALGVCLGASTVSVAMVELPGKGGNGSKEKPVLVAVPDVAYPGPRSDAWNVFVKYGLPVFHNVKEAIIALANVRSYYEIKESRE